MVGIGEGERGVVAVEDGDGSTGPDEAAGPDGTGVWTDLRGPTTCEVLTTPEVEAVLARLGPDPLRPRADGGRAFL